MAVSTPGHASGNSTVNKVRQNDMPQQAAASRASCGMNSNARWIGCTAKGILTMIEAITSPEK